MRRGSIGAIVLAGLVVAVAGCGHSSSHSAPQPSTTSRPAPKRAQQPTALSTTTSTAPAPTRVQLSTGATLVVALPTKPLASIQTSAPGVDLQVWSLQRSGDTVDAVYALDNTTDQGVNGLDGPYGQVLQGLDGGGSLGTYGGTFDQVGLLDTVALKEYLPFEKTDSETGSPIDCLCSDIAQAGIAANSTLYLGAVFPAPPATTTTVTFTSQAGDIADLPIAG